MALTAAHLEQLAHHQQFGRYCQGCGDEYPCLPAALRMTVHEQRLDLESASAEIRRLGEHLADTAAIVMALETRLDAANLTKGQQS